MIWFSSDWHFGHTNILRHQPSRLAAFDSIEDMDNAIIDSVNSCVKRNDVLYFLGDFCWQASRVGYYRSKLKVKYLHVCLGNHDATSLRHYVTTAQDMIYTRRNGHKIHMCHYPMLSWRASYHGSLHLYGHCHGMSEARLNLAFPDRRSMDVGIDAVHARLGEWRPISIDEIIEILVKDEKPRANGVPSRSEMYKILKERSR